MRRLTKRAQHGRHNSRLQGPSQAAIRIGRQAAAVARRHLHLLQLLAADRQAAADSPRRLLRQRTATSPRRRPALGGVYGGVAARGVDLPKNGGGNVPPPKKDERQQDFADCEHNEHAREDSEFLDTGGKRRGCSFALIRKRTYRRR
jgi:hypothetical protein